MECIDAVGNRVTPGDDMCAVKGHGDPHISVPHVHKNRCVECQLDIIEEMQREMKETLELLKTYMVKADTTIAAIAGEVKPTLDALTTNPMVKMFLKQGEKGAKK